MQGTTAQAQRQTQADAKRVISPAAAKAKPRSKCHDCPVFTPTRYPLKIATCPRTQAPGALSDASYPHHHVARRRLFQRRVWRCRTSVTNQPSSLPRCPIPRWFRPSATLMPASLTPICVLPQAWTRSCVSAWFPAPAVSDRPQATDRSCRWFIFGRRQHVGAQHSCRSGARQRHEEAHHFC